MKFFRRFLAMIANFHNRRNDLVGTITFLEDVAGEDLDFDWVDQEVSLLVSRGFSSIWVTREAIVYASGDIYRIVFRGGQRKIVPSAISQKIQLMDEETQEMLFRLISPGISMDAFGDIVEEIRLVKLYARSQGTKTCGFCKYYHGKGGLVCAVHPTGMHDCGDFERREN